MAKDLAKMKRSEFVQLIRRMVLASPTALSALGVKGFETDDEKEDDYDS
jgi:hypothetical protein